MEKKQLNESLRTLIVIILLMLGAILYLYTSNLNTKLKEQTNLVSSLNDTIKVWKDKDGLSHSKIEVIETSNPKDFINLKSNDKEVQDLQQLVKKYKKQLSNQGSATNFQTITKYDTIFKNNLVYSRDSVRVHTYMDSISNNWIYSKFGFRDSLTIFSLKVKNEYSVIIGEESQGWFKPKKPFVEVINLNPYSETTKVKTYQVETKPIKKIGIGPGVYYGIGNSFQPQVFVGIGIQYNFIRL